MGVSLRLPSLLARGHLHGEPSTSWHNDVARKPSGDCGIHRLPSLDTASSLYASNLFVREPLHNEKPRL